MRINPITPVYRVKPLPVMKVSYISLPVRTVGYEPTTEPAPLWLVAAGFISLGTLAVIAIALFGQ